MKADKKIPKDVAKFILFPAFDHFSCAQPTQVLVQRVHILYVCFVQVEFDEEFLEREKEGLASSAAAGQNDMEEGSDPAQDDILLQNAIHKLGE